MPSVSNSVVLSYAVMHSGVVSLSWCFLSPLYKDVVSQCIHTCAIVNKQQWMCLPQCYKNFLYKDFTL